MIKKFYNELITFSTYADRLKYLQLFGRVGQETFGYERYLNQFFYHRSQRWKEARNRVIIRDNGCDLGIEGMDIIGANIYVHHINPVTIEDLENENPDIWDPDFLISCSFETHQAIHYNHDPNFTTTFLPAERSPRDTCPWKKLNKEGGVKVGSVLDERQHYGCCQTEYRVSR